MAVAHLTFDLDDELKDAFVEAAQAADRNSADLLRDFVQGYVRTQKSEAPVVPFGEDCAPKAATSGKGNVIAALRRSPLVGADIDLVRTREAGRPAVF